MPGTSPGMTVERDKRPLLAAVDLALRDTISFDGAMVLKDQWEAKGLGTVSIRPVTFRWVNLSGTNPLFKDVRVKRALLHAIDRNSMVNNVFRGVAPIIHFPLSPFRKAYKRADAAAMKYGQPYARNRASATRASPPKTSPSATITISAAAARDTGQ